MRLNVISIQMVTSLVLRYICAHFNQMKPPPISSFHIVCTCNWIILVLEILVHVKLSEWSIQYAFRMYRVYLIVISDFAVSNLLWLDYGADRYRYTTLHVHFTRLEWVFVVEYMRHSGYELVKIFSQTFSMPYFPMLYMATGSSKSL